MHAQVLGLRTRGRRHPGIHHAHLTDPAGVVAHTAVATYGRFDDAAREYVISRPDTPLPWINYLGSEEYFGIISNTAGGYSFYRDARLRRLTRYRYNNVPTDVGGRYLYLRDDESGEFWSPSWQPVRAELEDYRCRHGLGYTVIGGRRAGIDAETLYAVPLGETLEVWRTRLTNHRPGIAQLSLFSAVEFCLWDALDDASNFQRNLSTGEVEVTDGVVYHTTEYRERRNHFAYFACSAPLAGFDTQRDAFLGPYRGWDRPLAVEAGRSTDSIAHGWAPCGSHHVTLTLEPGESHDVVFVLGYAENPKDAKFDPPGSRTVDKRRVKPMLDRYLQPGEVDAAVERLRVHWRHLLDTLQVTTPSEHVDRMVNVWNPYQCMVTFNLSRSASSFESGIGRGMGFRDSNQDLLGFVHMVPGRARERILDIAATQLPTGGASHQYQPLTKTGNDAAGSGFNDDPLWLVLAVTAYVKETGDRGILDEPVPYHNEPGSETPLYEHLDRALGYTLDRLGPHGLPLIGRADWNDCLNLNCFSETPGESFQTTENRTGGVAESVFIGGLFTLAAGWPRTSSIPTTRRGGGPRPGPWTRRCALTAGTGRGSAGRTTTTATPSAPPPTRRGGSTSSPRGCASSPASASTTAPPPPRSTPWPRSWPPTTASCSSSPPTPATTSSWARSARTRPATRRTPASSATPTRGS